MKFGFYPAGVVVYAFAMRQWCLILPVAMLFAAVATGNLAPQSTPYTESERDAHAAAERARRRAALVEEQIGVRLVEIETEHFLIFTDWARGDHPFLKRNLESAYTTVSRQFAIPARQTVFVGKLPVYMFDRQEDFSRFAREIDEAGAFESALGYYLGRRDGAGHMAMWKPDVAAEGGNLRRAQVRWARTLTHEFTHAFVHRYRTNRPIPRWLNEGLAEVIAEGQFPRENAEHLGLARLIAAEGGDLSFLFEDEYAPDGRYYPVLQTMTQMLIARDRRRYITLIDRIKDGAAAESALRELYGMDYPKLVVEWRRWVMAARAR